jgi:hypothetical protein
VRSLLALGFVACASAAPSPHQTVAAEPAKLPVVPAKFDVSALRASLEHDKLSGLALLAADAKLTPKRDAPDDARVPARVRAYVTILEDLGPVLRVKTALGRVPLAQVDDAYDLEVFVRRASLAPVLTHSIVKDESDGTGFVLLEGLEVALGERIAPLGVLAKVPVALTVKDVGLSFQLEATKPELTKATGPRLGCKSKYHEGTRVTDHKTLEDEAKQEWLDAHPNRGGGLLFDSYEMQMQYNVDQFPCRLQTLDTTFDPDRRDAPLVVGGVTIGNASEAREQALDTRRTRDGRALVTLDFGRAIVRATTSDTALLAGGRGSGAVAFGGKRPMIWQVSGNAPAYFPDGTRAGTHVGLATLLRSSTEIDGRVCTSRPYLTVQICHDKADLKEVEDRGY